MCGRYALGINIDELPERFNETVLNRDIDNEQYSIKQLSDTNYEAIGESNNETENECIKPIEIIISNLSNQTFLSSYNIPPTRTALIIYKAKASNSKFDSCYVIESLIFGLVPSWAQPKDPTPVMRHGKPGPMYSRELQKYQAKHFNCRKESLANKNPVWNNAKNTRCAVPIQGYFEWLKIGKEKTPYFVYSSKSPLIYVAALYSHNTKYNVKDTDSKYLSSFTIITGPATKKDSKDLSWLHLRKPIMLLPGSNEWHEWLDSEKEWSDCLLGNSLNTVDNKAYMNIEHHTVSSDVGKSLAEGKHLIEKNATSAQRPISQFFKPVNKRRFVSNEKKQHEKKPKIEDDIDAALTEDQGIDKIKKEP